jgi:RES domain-containing protein
VGKANSEINRDELRQRLESIEPIVVASKWVNKTTFADLSKNVPPNWLYTSGDANRYNPKGVHCVYFAADERTAQAEFLKRADEKKGPDQPIVTYFADIRLRRVLDLTQGAVVRQLRISRAQLLVEWDGKDVCVTHILGEVVNEGGRFSAIQFPSAAANESGFQGVNLVVFRDALRKPDFVGILGPSKKSLQTWPE